MYICSFRYQYDTSAIHRTRPLADRKFHLRNVIDHKPRKRSPCSLTGEPNREITTTIVIVDFVARASLNRLHPMYVTKETIYNYRTVFLFNTFPVRNFGNIPKIFERCCDTDTKYISKNCVASCSRDWLMTNEGSSYWDESNVRRTCAITRIIFIISRVIV